MVLGTTPVILYLLILELSLMSLEGPCQASMTLLDVSKVLKALRTLTITLSLLLRLMDSNKELLLRQLYKVASTL
jgi:hypothetical protein